MPLHYIEEHGFSRGMLRDAFSALLPPGALYDAQNILFDKPGVARQRGGTTAIFAGSQTSFATALGFVSQKDFAVLSELYGVNGKSGHLFRINQATGATTDLGLVADTDGIYGRAVPHFGFTLFPGAGDPAASITGPTRGVWVAGAISTASFFNANTATLGLRSATITLSGGDVTTNVKVGQIVTMAGSGFIYTGRVTNILSSTQFNVWPANNAGAISAGFSQLQTQSNLLGFNSVCAASFQGRILLGGVTRQDPSGLPIIYDRRVAYSTLLTERGFLVASDDSGGADFVGNSQGGWLEYNWFESPFTSSIVGMEPVHDNELLILTQTHPSIFRGELVSYFGTTDPTVTYDIVDLPVVASCAADHSIVRTSQGIMWAGTDGIFIYTGGGNVDNVLDKHNATLWRDLARSSTFAVHGAAYIRGHYLVTGTSGGTTFGVMINLTSREFLFSRTLNLDFFAAVSKPGTQQQVFSAIWWDQAGAAPSRTNGQVVRLESMLDSYTPGTTKTDSDGSGVSFSLTSRVLTDDPGVTKTFQAVQVRYQAAEP